MRPEVWLLEIVLLVVLLQWLLRFDARAERLVGLKKDGAACTGWRVVRAGRWVNLRTGLLNHAALAPRTGLWLSGASAVHTRGMLFAIDVVFVDRNGKVLAVYENVVPETKRVAGPKGSAAVLEVAAGAARASADAGGLGLVEGIRLEAKS